MKGLLQLSVPSLILAGILLIESLIPSVFLFHSYKWILLFFFFAQSYISHKIINFGLETDQRKFYVYYFSSMIIRIILSSVLLLVLLFQKVENTFVFVLTFFIFYFYHIVFEIYYLLGNLRANSK